MDSKKHSDYQILKAIGDNPEFSQRSISEHTGLNLASVNYALRNLVKRGYVKITNMNKKRVIYHLTPSGISSKGKLAYDFFVRNYHIFSELGNLVSHKIEEGNLQGKRIAIFGLNEASEVVYLALKKGGVDYSGIYEEKDGPVGESWIDGVIMDIAELADDIDYLIDVKNISEDISKLKFIPVKEFAKIKR
ncbi:MAG: winged helix-turn-helix transcriptional regulator [Nitrospinota bacterium]